jgi:hypothetical protein
VDVVVVGVVVCVVLSVVELVQVDSGVEAGRPFLCRARSTRLANVTEELNEN